MNSACLRGNRNIAIINIMHLESAAFPRSSKHCTYIILFLLATCKGSKRQQWAIFRGKKTKTKTNTVYRSAFELNWNQTKSSQYGRKEANESYSQQYLTSFHIFLNAREGTTPSEWDTCTHPSRERWLTEPLSSFQDLQLTWEPHFPLELCSFLDEWPSPVPEVGILSILISDLLQGRLWNSTRRVRNVPHCTRSLPLKDIRCI